MAKLVGRRLGKHEIREHIGEGGMANVYKGYHPALKKSVAIKVLKSERSKDSAFVAAFVNEAITAANLSHPHIVTIYDVDEEDGCHYIVMEYVSGQSLQQLIRARGGLSPKAVCGLFNQIAEALNYAHSRGFVHCDVKPTNILLTADGQVKLTDFGIARAVTQARAAKQRKRLIGTPRYMSPEHARGRPLDRRSDIYSLGVVLFELLTGRVPFGDDSSSKVLAAHVSQQPPVPSSVNRRLPKDMDKVVLRALAKDPEKRYQSALEMARALERALLPGRGQLLRRLLVGVSALAALLAVAVLFGWWPLGDENNATPTATLVYTSTVSGQATKVGETLFPTATSTASLGPTSTLVPTETEVPDTATPTPLPATNIPAPTNTPTNTPVPPTPTKAPRPRPTATPKPPTPKPSPTR